MAEMDFGLTIRPTPQGGTVPEMLHANERLLHAATEHDLSCWIIDHFITFVLTAQRSATLPRVRLRTDAAVPPATV